MIEFLDSSALVKRYVPEPGSALIRRLCASGEIAVSRVVFAEVAAAVARASREGGLTDDDRDRVLDQLADDVDAFQTIELRRAVVEATRPLVTRHPLRGYDAVQLASAMAIQGRGRSLRFWSADSRLVAAARSEGLRAQIPA
ncbi:MAG: type II toxin-antitoxin system VapC family toxin [Deltaproteobacteria bacterium]|nr:type II toxin-antitoxin system VapC family toxin [Deltaproteobacteria bacterium]